MSMVCITDHLASQSTMDVIQSLFLCSKPVFRGWKLCPGHQPGSFLRTGCLLSSQPPAAPSPAPPVREPGRQALFRQHRKKCPGKLLSAALTQMEVKGKERGCSTLHQEALGQWKHRGPALGHPDQEPIAHAGPGLLQHLLCLPAKVRSPWSFPLPSCWPQEGRQEPVRE